MKKKLKSDSPLRAATCSPSSVRAFRVTETGYFDKPTVTIIRTTTPARAKHRVWDSAHSAGYLIEFKSLNVVRAPEYDAVKLKQNWCYSEDFARSILPENVQGVARRKEDSQSEANEGRYPPLPLPSCSFSSSSSEGGS